MHVLGLGFVRERRFGRVEEVRENGNENEMGSRKMIGYEMRFEMQVRQMR